MDNTLSYMLRLEHLTHGYDGKIVLNDIDLKVRTGELVTLVGPSGCGKSTFLRLLLGAESPNHGKVFIGGTPKLRPDKDCGVVYQKYSVFPHLTVLNNVAFGLNVASSTITERAVSSVCSRVSGRPMFSYARQCKDNLVRAEEILCQLELEGVLDKYPHQLSGGMQQRVAIAQALIMKPKVLLLDEPFSALDPWVRRQLQLLLAKIWKSENMTILFITHDLEEAVYLGTRLLVLSPHWRDGKKKGSGSKIMADISIPSLYDFDAMDELEAMKIQREKADDIRRLGFEKRTDENLIPPEKFLLQHPDSKI
ncbi:MAG: ABC transporter ATP-binding protein [Candidatus Nealsonbacteria bacterium]|nr:ABC transporter ATP-binding protein [Candidatus Nealsonbacteria bacterium]